jgi:REP element-mobilizing transposase RayT
MSSAAAARAYTLHAHLLIVTKHRRPVFTGEMLTTCQHRMADRGEDPQAPAGTE